MSLHSYFLPETEFWSVTRLKKGYSAEKLGRFRSVFSNEQELEIVAHCKELNKRFYGISFKSLRFLLFHYAESNKIPSPFNKDKMAAGKDFAIAFMRRHRLSLRIPRKTSVARTMGFNRVQIGHYFENLKEAYEKYGFTPERIYNIDETGVQTVPGKLSKIVSDIGQKEVSKNVSAEQG